MTPPVVLTIAGSDSGGGAGIQADLRTFAAFGVHGCSAIAAMTAQNTTEVRRVVATDPDFLREQIVTVLDDLPVAAVKTGMLATADNIRVVAELAAAGRLPNLVVDPVMVSSTGARLLDVDAEKAYVQDLFPHALVVTPNVREAAVLLGSDEPGGGQPFAASAALLRSGAAIAVITGGDVPSKEVRDIVAWRDRGTAEDDGNVHLRAFGPDGEFDLAQKTLLAPRVETKNNHGTGCSFAAATAAGLARGDDALTAIDNAKQFVHGAIERAAAWTLGRGHGPIDHIDFAHPPIARQQRTTP